MLSKRLLIAAGAVAFLAASGGAAYFAGVFTGKAADAPAAQAAAPQGPPPATVHVAEAVSASLSPLSDAPGSIVSVRDSLVAAATAGKIVWVADVGDEVEEGGVIARIDPADAAFALGEARAEVSRLRSRSEYLDRLYQRWESLGEESGESEAALDQMRADRDEARQSLARARVALDRAETNFQRTEVRAPFAGRIVSREIQIGEFAASGSPVARLVDTRNVEVTAQAPAALLRSVKPGDEIVVTYGAETVRAPIRAVVPVGDEVSRTLELRLVLPPNGWHIGSAVRVSLPTATPREVVAAHRDALVLRANRISVFKIDEDMIAHRIDVELGAAEGELIEVIGDVSAGDRLVVRGGERLRDGQKVVISQTPLTLATS